MAGVAPFRRVLSSRASATDLWASLDALAASPTKLRAIHNQALDVGARRRFSAYVHQAEQYYSAVPGADPAAKPLIAYYFALNLTKAFLTAKEPITTEVELFHGLTPDPETKQRYRFTQEWFKVKQAGVLRLLAERTGQGFCWGRDRRIQLKRVLAYLPEAVDLYADAYGKRPRLVPIEDAYVLFGDTTVGKSAWLRIEVGRNVLRQGKLSPEGLPKEARALGDRFRLVDDPDIPGCASFESMKAFRYHRRSDVLSDLGQLYDGTLVASQRYRQSNPRFLVPHRRRYRAKQPIAGHCCRRGNVQQPYLHLRRITIRPTEPRTLSTTEPTTGDSRP